MKRIICFLVAGIVVLGCVIPSFLSPTLDAASANCSNIAITDSDVESTLSYGKQFLNGGDWVRSYTVNTDQVYVSYISAELSAVVYVDTLALCNAPVELKAYASEVTLATLLSNYEGHRRIASCEKDGILLFQFMAFNSGTNYDVNLWFASLENPNRALQVMLVFQQTDPTSMEKYSTAFFPELTTCK